MIAYNYKKKRIRTMQTKNQYEKKADERFKIEITPFDYDNPEHFHRAIEIAYILKNNYEVSVQNHAYTIKTNEIIIISSRMAHSAKEQDATAGFSLVIPYEYFSYFPKIQHTMTPCFLLRDVKYNREVLLPILKLFLEQEKNRSNRDMKIIYDAVLLGWTNLLFGKILNHYSLNFLTEEKKESGFTEQILFFIDNNYMKPDLSLQTIAEAFGYNPSYLSRIFKKYFFVPLNKYIRSVRIQKFINLHFMEAHVNILKLAMECGFSTASAFYRAFREETSTTPTTLSKSNEIMKKAENRIDLL